MIFLTKKNFAKPGIGESMKKTLNLKKNYNMKPRNTIFENLKKGLLNLLEYVFMFCLINWTSKQKREIFAYFKFIFLKMIIKLIVIKFYQWNFTFSLIRLPNLLSLVWNLYFLSTILCLLCLKKNYIKAFKSKATKTGYIIIKILILNFIN